MTQPVLRECSLGTFGAIGSFDDELITGDMEGAIARIESCSSPLEAVQLVLATFRRSDSVVDDREIDRLAAAIGVFEDDAEDEDGDA